MTSLIYRLLALKLWLIGWILLPFMGWFRHRHHAWLKQRLLPQSLQRQPKLWIHAVSVGEIKIALALFRALPANRRDQVLFTTTTPSGMVFLEQHLPQGADRRLLPWDFQMAYQRMFGVWNVPPLLVVETEIWPGLFTFVKKHGASLGIANARLSSKTLRWRKLSVLRRSVAKLDWVAARSELDAKRFIACGLPAERVAVTGNIKFDFEAAQLQRGPLKQWLAHAEPVLVFASMATDEAPLLAAEVKRLLAWSPSARILWAPRHIEDVAQHLEALAESAPLRRTQLKGNPRLLVLDTLGELSGCYAFAQLSFVGGSFNARGGQNFLESLQVGTPALVGPSTENFRVEVAEALDIGAIGVIQRPEEVGGAMIGLLEDPEKRSQMAIAGKSFLTKHVGAVARTVQVLLDSQSLGNPLSEVV